MFTPIKPRISKGAKASANIQSRDANFLIFFLKYILSYETHHIPTQSPSWLQITVLNKFDTLIFSIKRSRNRA